MQNKRPYILITNDDGYSSLGIKSLAESILQIGDIVVVAPDGPRSGKAAALTPDIPIRIRKIKQGENETWYKCSGTPVDCVKVSLAQLLDRRPDLIVSGINHGSNAAINAMYSGTMGAAFEGCTHGIPSIGFSLCTHAEEPDFSEAKRIVSLIASTVSKNGLPEDVCLNVNIPNTEKVEGIRMCRQTRSRWIKDFEKETDPRGNAAYWLTGDFVNLEPESNDTDEWALAHGYASVVPCKLDYTDYTFLKAAQPIYNQL